MRNRHHLWWPKTKYRHGIRKVFRELPCQIIYMDMEAHKLLHLYTPPPEVPSTRDMQAAIDRHNSQTCGCYQ